MLALQSSEISDAITMLAIEVEISEKSTMKASYTDLKRLVQSMRNLSLTINKAASYIKSYKSSTKKLLAIYIKAKK